MHGKDRYDDIYSLINKDGTNSAGVIKDDVIFVCHPERRFLGEVVNDAVNGYAVAFFIIFKDGTSTPIMLSVPHSAETATDGIEKAASA